MLRNKILYLEKLTRVEGLFKRNSYSVSSVFTLRKVNIEVRPDLGRMTRNPHSVSQVITHTFYTSTYIVSADLLQIVSFLWRKKPWSLEVESVKYSEDQTSKCVCRFSPVVILLSSSVEQSQLDVVFRHGNIHSVVIEHGGNIFPWEFTQSETEQSCRLSHCSISNQH